MVKNNDPNYFDLDLRNAGDNKIFNGVEDEIYVIQSHSPDNPGYWSELYQDWVPLMEASILCRKIERFWGTTITFSEALKEEGFLI